MQLITHNKNMQHKEAERGQVMLFSVLVISAVFLSVTVIAGLLVVNQLSQVTRAIDSASAIYAADAAIERGLFYTNRCNPSDPTNPVIPTWWDKQNVINFCGNIASQEPGSGATEQFPPLFLNDATYRLSFFPNQNNPSAVRATGRSGKSARAFEVTF